MKVLYPGSFDPLTLGHLDLIQRASSLFGEVVVAVLHNPDKKPTFSLERRIAQITSSTKNLDNITIISFGGLTVECARENNVKMILLLVLMQMKCY